MVEPSIRGINVSCISSWHHLTQFRAVLYCLPFVWLYHTGYTVYHLFLIMNVISTILVINVHPLRCIVHVHVVLLFSLSSTNITTSSTTLVFHQSLEYFILGLDAWSRNWVFEGTEWIRDRSSQTPVWNWSETKYCLTLHDASCQ